MKTYDYIVVGSGFYGSVIAERLHNSGKTVLIIEKRDHIGGNCYSYTYPDTDIDVDKYGTHIFHTSNKAVWDYINSFGEFNRYQHRVLTTYKNKVYSMPINLGTINSFFGTALTPYQVENFLSGQKDATKEPCNLEEKVISLIGRPLYEAFIKGYTQKQWACDPKELPMEIITRLPVRKSYRDSYFNEPYQGIPVSGFTSIFKKMLTGVPVELNTDFFTERDYWQKKCRKLIYTGPIDRYFDYIHGKLSWRSVTLETELVNYDDFQGTSVMNYADLEIPYTRIHEPKHLHPEKKFETSCTVIQREYSVCNEQEPYYPVNSAKDREVFALYQKEVKMQSGTFFGGRLAEYKYFDMHHVIEKALNDVLSIVQD